MSLKLAVLIALGCEEQPNGCWEWQGATDKDGYGVLTFEGEYHRTHRSMLGCHIDLASSQLALHHCDNPPCCNPSHLYPGDVAANSKDMMVRKRGKNQFVAGEEHPQAKLSNADVAAIRASPEYRGMSTFLAKTYEVSRATITAVRKGKHYKV